MKLTTFSHHFGQEAISSNVSNTVSKIILSTKFNFETSKSADLRKLIMNQLKLKEGWSDEIRIQQKHGLTITSIKDDVGLCFQTGNMSRFYADLLKLQTLYIKDKISAAIYILPTKKVAEKIGTNVVNSERLIMELKLFKHTITVPLLVIALDEDEEE